MEQVVELVLFKLRENVDTKEFMEASRKFEEQFLKKQTGLIERKLIFSKDTWGDLAVWDSIEAAKAIESAMPESKEANMYNSFIEMSSIEMKHFEVKQ